MRYLSVCSGIEAASVAWAPLGWTAHAFAEIEAFPSAVLTHHYPKVPNYGDLTAFAKWPDATVNVLVGGTPCQSFSVAGLRAGLADPRGNLALVYLALADRYRPAWVVWENVPGVLSSEGGRDFGAFVGALGRLGYGFAYRVLDAQYFGLAQRRKRVFVVGCLGDWRRAAAVLFERESLSGHPAPRREAGEKPAPTLGAGPVSGGRTYGTDADSADSLIAFDWNNSAGAPNSSDTFGTLSTERSMAIAIQGAGTRSLGPHMNGCGISDDGVMYTLLASKQHAVAFAENQRGEMVTSDTMGSLKVGGGKSGQGYPAVAFDWQSGGDMRGIDPRPLAQLQSEQIPATLNGMQVRRLTPRECERLQGFPDDYTLIPYRGKPAADGPRYKALGNSMAVPVMRWVGQRIQMVSEC